jgi:glutaredoxin-related protein
MKRQQQHIFDILSAHKINFVPVDVAASEIVKEVLKAESPRELKLPQIWRGKEFLGGHEEFENSVEGEYLKEFLKEF